MTKNELTPDEEGRLLQLIYKDLKQPPTTQEYQAGLALAKKWPLRLRQFAEKEEDDTRGIMARGILQILAGLKK